MRILSVPSRTLPFVSINPWQRLAEEHPNLDVRYEDLAHKWGVTRWYKGRAVHIVLHERLTQVQRRVTLAHELEHIDRGAPCASLRASIERRVINATAKYLIPDVDLLARVLSVYDLRAAAEELWVTFPVLVDRIRCLTDDELDFVASRRDAVA